jgi:hypothetical protein
VAQDATRVTLDSGGNGEQVFDQNNVTLTAGTSADGDGAVLQLGYYSGASTGNNFAGTWIALSGEGSLNTATVTGSSPAIGYNETSIGDITAEGAGPGQFALTLDFVSGSATSGNSLPSSTTIPLSVRFYNGTTIANSTHYNVVSNDLWLWENPTTPPNVINISLGDLGLEWESIVVYGQAANSEFHTTIPVPEPSTIFIAALSTAAVGWNALRRLARKS